MVRCIAVTKNITAPETATVFKEHVYRNYGLTEKIVSDRDPIFMSNFWKSLFKTFGTKLSPSSAYHPETDDQSEIMSREVEEMIGLLQITTRTIGMNISWISRLHTTHQLTAQLYTLRYM